ncbi:OLE1 Fatty-acid desaturase [uncultured Caudovirales phage]|uniref:OLE1 Fatty-acid desaturase n=1 Tax=uncultured Caudovirales phage TaxID=2100421 RepID=A0A6J7WSI3_9CAUD|nr:OLE1 Fatty-acid desaturase [uncultured Caudovirales phage]CAB4124024.1 OLE1 Fatty-acid desaturase [uncultured Caudovirales phage]CAB5219682.1 OLE1 Fatty-acid desaturase [uncultured Caudovirales phage]
MDIFIKQNKWRILLGIIYASAILGIGLAIAGMASLWWLLAGLVTSKIVQLIGHSIGLHRFFSHKSFDTTKTWENVMAWVSILLGIGSPIQYARNHRFHHRTSDTKDDIHSSHFDGRISTALGLWAFHDVSWFMTKGTEATRDLMSNPTLRFINKHYYPIWYSLIAITLLIDWRITLYLLMLPSFIFHLEVNGMVNTACHIWGYRNFETKDYSRNLKWVAYWMMGEGYHNNHHARPHLWDCGVKEDEWDGSAWFIEKFMAIDGRHTRAGKIRID